MTSRCPRRSRGRCGRRGPRTGDGPVFATSTSRRLSDHNVRRVLDAAGDRADLGCVPFHTFRHTIVSVLFEGGKNIKQVSRWLGYSDEAFTLRTDVHLTDDGLGGADFDRRYPCTQPTGNATPGTPAGKRDWNPAVPVVAAEGARWCCIRSEPPVMLCPVRKGSRVRVRQMAGLVAAFSRGAPRRVARRAAWPAAWRAVPEVWSARSARA